MNQSNKDLRRRVSRAPVALEVLLGGRMLDCNFDATECMFYDGDTADGMLAFQCVKVCPVSLLLFIVLY